MFLMDFNRMVTEEKRGEYITQSDSKYGLNNQFGRCTVNMVYATSTLNYIHISGNMIILY